MNHTINDSLLKDRLIKKIYFYSCKSKSEYISESRKQHYLKVIKDMRGRYSELTGEKI